MIFHLSKAPSPNQAVIRTNDTDVLIIALGCFKHLPEDLLVWLDVGLLYNNTRRYIYLNQLHGTWYTFL